MDSKVSSHMADSEVSDENSDEDTYSLKNRKRPSQSLKRRREHPDEGRKAPPQKRQRTGSTLLEEKRGLSRKKPSGRTDEFAQPPPLLDASQSYLNSVSCSASFL